jgi:hypothetical protein
MATPPANPRPSEPKPAVVVTVRLHFHQSREHRPAPLGPRRPPRELPPVSQLQRYLDMSG